MNESSVIQRLNAVRDNEYRVPADIDAYTVCADALPLLGSPDPLIRDELAYSVIARILVSGTLSRAEIGEIARLLISEEYLFSGSESGTPASVLKRSFSMLLLAPVVYEHRENAVLSPAMLGKVKDAVIRYAASENDFTGYREPYGWAHAAAHTADTLDELFQCREFDEDELESLLEALCGMLLANEEVYAHAEDERLAYAVASLVKNGGLPLERIMGRLDELAAKHEREFSDIRKVRRAINIRAFLRALFIHFAGCSAGGEFREYLLAKLRSLMQLEQGAE